MKLCLKILSVPWYMLNGLEYTAILSHFLTFITGSSSRLLCIRFFADLTMHWFPVQGISAISDMDLESKYYYFYHSWDFIPYYESFTSDSPNEVLQTLNSVNGKFDCSFHIREGGELFQRPLHSRILATRSMFQYKSLRFDFKRNFLLCISSQILS